MASNDDQDEDDGVRAYNLIQAELGQWGSDFATTPASTPRRYSAGFSRYYDETPPAPAASTTTTPAASARPSRLRENYHEDHDDMEEESDGGSPSSSSCPPQSGAAGGRGPVGVQTPEPPSRGLRVPATDERALVETTDGDVEVMEEQIIMKFTTADEKTGTNYLKN